MRMKSVVYFILWMLPAIGYSHYYEESLSGSPWKFRKKEDKSWHKATVPGTVHTDLFANKLIPDPFYGSNEKQLQWIENEDWEYTTTFKIIQWELFEPHVELQFDGLDTYAKIFVNDSLVLSADNMFRSWNVDVKKYIHKGKNKLRIVFESAVKRGKEEAKKLSYTLPGDEKVFTRKAQYQYGWDWGPRFVTCGIWKDVKLIFWRDMKINSIQYDQNFLSDSIAKLKFKVEVMSDTAGEFISIMYQNNYRAKEFDDNKAGTYVKLKKGLNIFVIEHQIARPKLWWSNGLGEHPIYEFSIHVSDIDTTHYVAGGPTDFQPRPYYTQIYDSKKVEIGLRTIELIQDEDSIGKSFYFKLNGVPVFMKGANFIPPDNFLPRVQEEDYEEIIENAVEANMNMLRVWGGGVYADDAFYDACDKNGILVWQDFMFACAMYPGDDHFVNNVAEEVIDQTKRLRNHSCVALWCGNNEVDEGWKNWEWQKQYQYSEKDSTTIAQNNYALFDNLIKDLVNTYDGSRAYWPSSPSIGWGHKESLTQGDSHYWGVWWGMEPFENYEKKVGRFVSEYGFQGMPSLNTMNKFGAYFPSLKGVRVDVVSDSSDRYFLNNFRNGVDSSALKNHQKHPTGYKTINTYMERDYIVPENFEDYVYVSQLLQAEGVKTAIEAHRRAKPYCMGTLYWQLNDCWPVTSWSSVDYYNDWKASHYQVKRSFEDVIVSVEEKEDNCNVYVVSDLMKNIKVDLAIELFDFYGKLLWSNYMPVELTSNSSKIYYKFDNTLIKGFDKNKIVLKCTLTQIENHKYVNSFHYFVKPKDLHLTRGNIKVIPDYVDGIQCITICSDVLMKDVSVSIDGESINLNDNYFDIFPNKARTVYLPNSIRLKNLGKKIKIKSLIDTY